MKFKPEDILEAGRLGREAALKQGVPGGLLTLPERQSSYKDETPAAAAFAEAAANHLLEPLLARNTELEKELEAIKECRSGHENTINEIARIVFPCPLETPVPSAVLKSDLLAKIKKVFTEARAAECAAADAKPAPQTLLQGGISATQVAIARVCDGLRDMLLEKNRNYGDSCLNPMRIFSKADPIEGINIRLDDKISRLVRGQAAGEDVERDLVGYLILKMVAVELNDRGGSQ